ncbi:MAG: T9SS type A sorting domain-containing protein [Candidatus Coatesbacteria bacterium]|nr:T9SS type A sorting domain-containing protein [Candidatus Coatesbacteria bacterium]
MKKGLILLIVLGLGLIGAQALVRVQDSWVDGPSEPGPVTEFGEAFASGAGINFYYWGNLWLGFQPNLTPTQHAVGTQNAAYYAKTGDIDSDRDDDVFASSSASEDFVWFENQGNGVFSAANTIIPSTAYVAYNFVDLDFDMDGDLIIGIDQGSHHFSWFENDGGSFTEHVIDPDFSQVDMGVAVDFDQDGDLDIFAGAYQSSALKWFENLGWNSGEGDFDWAIHVLVASGHNGAENIGLASGDFNDDGWIDVAFSCRGNGEIVWWEYDENWTDPTAAFIEHVIDTGVSQAYSCVAEDIDWDNDLDLVTSSRNGRIDWYENDGTGAFTHHSIATGYSGCREVTPIDADYDGDYDILSASQTANTLDWWDNDGSMNFTQRSWATGYDGAHGVVSGSFTDTRAPLGLTTANTDDTVDWWDITEGYRTTGTLHSSVLDTEIEDPDWHTFFFNETERPDTTIEYYIRGGDSYDDCVNAAWIGPYDEIFNIGDAMGEGLRFFQYRVDMGTTNPDFSPTVNQIQVYFYDPAAVDDLVIDTATRDEGVLVSWSTQQQAAAYDLLRAPAAEADIETSYTKLNDIPLPGNQSVAYLDRDCAAGGHYAYKVRVTADDGEVSTFGPVIGTAPGEGYGLRPVLRQSHPNPTNYLARIEFELPAAATVNLELFDISGRLVQRVIDERALSAGAHNATVNTAPLASGVYLYRLSVDEVTLTRRMVVER